MKTIKYFILILIFSGVFASFIPKDTDKKRAIIVECETERVSEQDLEQSRDIIKARFKYFDKKWVKIKMLDNNRLKVKVPNRYSEQIASRLASARGKIAFYECKENTKTLAIVKQKFNKKQQEKLFAMLKPEKTTSFYNAILGRASAKDTAKINQLLDENIQADENIKLFWGKKDPKSNDFPLYGLNSAPFSGREQIKKVKMVFETTYLSNQIQLSFNEAGKEIWLKTTQKNLNKTVALVVDQKVFFAPIVRNEIKAGDVIISSGNSTNDEINMLYALLKAQELPVNFRIVD